MNDNEYKINKLLERVKDEYTSTSEEVSVSKHIIKNLLTMFIELENYEDQIDSYRKKHNRPTPEGKYGFIYKYYFYIDFELNKISDIETDLCNQVCFMSNLPPNYVCHIMIIFKALYENNFYLFTRECVSSILNNNPAYNISIDKLFRVYDDEQNSTYDITDGLHYDEELWVKYLNVYLCKCLSIKYIDLNNSYEDYNADNEKNDHLVCISNMKIIDSLPRDTIIFTTQDLLKFF